MENTLLTKREYLALCILQTLIAAEKAAAPGARKLTEEERAKQGIELKRTLESLAVESADRLMVCLGVAEGQVPDKPAGWWSGRMKFHRGDTLPAGASPEEVEGYDAAHREYALRNAAS